MSQHLFSCESVLRVVEKEIADEIQYILLEISEHCVKLCLPGSRNLGENLSGEWGLQMDDVF